MIFEQLEEQRVISLLSHLILMSWTLETSDKIASITCKTHPTIHRCSSINKKKKINPVEDLPPVDQVLSEETKMKFQVIEKYFLNHEDQYLALEMFFTFECREIVNPGAVVRWPYHSSIVPGCDLHPLCKLKVIARWFISIASQKSWMSSL